MSMSEAELNTMLAGLDADPWERQQLAETIDEAAADPAGDYDPDGPWHDFEAAAAQMDRSRQLDGQRIAEDITDGLARRPSAEDKLVRAFRRIESGTYHEPSRPDPHGLDSATCGPLSDLGTCGARYHAADCSATAEAALATGSADEARAWNDGLNRTAGGAAAARALGLAHEQPGLGEDLWSDLLSPPGGQDTAVREQVLAMLGGEGRADQPRPVMRSRQPRSDVSGLRQELGL